MKRLVLTDLDFIGLNRVAQGSCLPRAPTDPYVHALVHTVPQIMGSLRAAVDSAWLG